MSTDFDIVCDACKKCHHLGQRTAGTFSFGWGRGPTHDKSDIATEESIGEFITDHFNHNRTGLRLVLSDALSEICTSIGFEDVTNNVEESCE